MVDAAERHDAAPSRAQAQGRPAGSHVWHVSIAPFDAEAMEIYARFCREAGHAAPQHPRFIASWREAIGPDMVIAHLQAPDAEMMLPLSIVRRGPFTLAALVGERHANGSFPPLRSGNGAHAASLDVALKQALRSARPDVDLLFLERLEPERFGLANPLWPLAYAASPNIALAADLSEGFEGLLARMSGRRKRKKYRAQLRRFEEAGGWRIYRAGSEAEVDHLFDSFLALKRERFRKMGISDVFTDPDLQAFFRRLFKESLDDERPAFFLEALEVGGVIRSVTGSSIAGDRITCEFGAISEDELTHMSPGEFLFFDSIRRAAEAGFAWYDFGVGDEPYKRLWAEAETVHFDVALPLSAKGMLLRQRFAGSAALKRHIKTSRFWPLVKRLRSALSGARAPRVDQAAE